MEVEVRFQKRVLHHIKPNQNLSLYSQFYANACNELAGLISASLRSSNKAWFCGDVELLETLYPILLAQNPNLKPLAPETNAISLDQPYSVLDRNVLKLLHWQNYPKTIAAVRLVG